MALMLSFSTYARTTMDIDADDGGRLEHTTQIDEDTSFTWFWERYPLTTFVVTPDGPGGDTENEDKVGFYWTWRF